MDLLRQFQARPHHAYWLVGDPMTARERVTELFRQVTGLAPGLPDFLCLEIGNWGIDLSRQLAAWAWGRPLVASRRFFVVILESITTESQNALLKILEEPPPASHFFILSVTDDLLLPTVASRLCRFSLRPNSAQKESKKSPPGVAFITAPMDRRLNQATRWVKESETVARLREIEIFWHGLRSKLETAKFAAGLAALTRARRDLAQRGLPPRLALETLALTLPLVQPSGTK